MAEIRGEIVDPPKSSAVSAALLLCLIVIFGLQGTNALTHDSLLLRAIVLLILPLTIARRCVYALHFNIFLIFCYLMSWFPHFSRYPYNELTSLFLYGYAVMAIPALRQSVGWIRIGKFDGPIWRLVLMASVLSCASLVTWVKLVNPNLSRYSVLLPNQTSGMFLLYGLLFCAFNAAEEEIVWRGVIMEGLDSAFGPGALSIIIQAASFATAHYLNGFPNGITGSLMVFACGLMLGVIRRKSKGMAACWLAHMAADFTIYCLIYSFIEKSQK
jgi:membrane protease YdiL (CAAX protease family)